MENLINIINDFSNYLLNNCVSDEGRDNIKGAIVNAPNFVKLNSVKFYREDNESENKSIIEEDKNKNDVIVKKYSQLKNGLIFLV